MLDQNIAVSVEEIEFPPYASDFIKADELSTINQLKRMYPNVSGIEIHDAQTRRYILDRTMHNMLHLDKVFTMEAVFDQEHFDQMKAEAIAYMEWLDSPDDTPLPEILKYKVAGPVIEEVEEVKPSLTETDKAETEQPKRERMKRGPSGNSAYQRALAVYNEDVAAGRTRASTLERFNQELGIAANTANVYYSKFKHAGKSK